PRKIHVAHILVRHAALPEPQGATRSREAACLRALEALEALAKDGADFDATAGKFSDSPSFDLGRVSADELDAAFAAAAFSLSPNELSYVVETGRGFHVILRKE